HSRAPFSEWWWRCESAPSGTQIPIRCCGWTVRRCPSRGASREGGVDVAADHGHELGDAGVDVLERRKAGTGEREDRDEDQRSNLLAHALALGGLGSLAVLVDAEKGPPGEAQDENGPDTRA